MHNVERPANVVVSCQTRPLLDSNFRYRELRYLAGVSYVTTHLVDAVADIRQIHPLVVVSQTSFSPDGSVRRRHNLLHLVSFTFIPHSSSRRLSYPLSGSLVIFLTLLIRFSYRHYVTHHADKHAPEKPVFTVVRNEFRRLLNRKTFCRLTQQLIRDKIEEVLSSRYNNETAISFACVCGHVLGEARQLTLERLSSGYHNIVIVLRHM